MKAPQKALLLVGSPKPGESTSASLGAYLLEELEKRGVATQSLHVTKAVRNEESVEELLAAAASADLVVLSFPLYVDCLPAPATCALELVAAARAGSADSGAADDPRRRSSPSASPALPRPSTALWRSRSAVTSRAPRGSHGRAGL